MAELNPFAVQLQRLHDLGGERFVQKMIALFLQTAAPRAEAIRKAVTTADWPVVEFEAHSLKSSAGNIGANRVQDLASRIEELAAARQVDGLADLAVELSESMNEAVDHLRTLTKGDLP